MLKLQRQNTKPESCMLTKHIYYIY